MSDSYRAYAEYWDGAAQRNGPTNSAGWWQGADPDVTLPPILEAFAPQDVRAVYDIGCGGGVLFPHVRRLWPLASYCGVDVSQVMIDATCASYPNGCFLKIHGLWLPGQPADFIAMHQVMMHISPDDARAWLALIRERLAPAGRASISIHYNSYDLPFTQDGLRRLDYRSDFFEDMLEEAGLRVVRFIDGALPASAWGPDAQRWYCCEGAGYE